MFNVSDRALAVIAVVAVALLIFGLVASFFPGWVAALILGAYVIVALIKRRGAAPSRT